MVLYKIGFKKSAVKELEALDKKTIRNVWEHIKKLSENPKPVNSIKLWGSTSCYRIRIGDYRVIYLIDNKIKTITIQRIKHRKEVYR